MPTKNQKINKNKNLYQCIICKLWYKNKNFAKKCEIWCKKNKSCNLEIIKHSVKIT